MCVSFALHYLSGAGKAIIPVKKISLLWFFLGSLMTTITTTTTNISVVPYSHNFRGIVVLTAKLGCNKW